MSSTHRDTLIIFTRYPAPGRTKTRLIPALGPAGAARLHEVLTRRTLQTAAELARGFPVRVEVHVAGGAPAEIASWLGPAWTWRPQTGGDLGARMRAALEGASAGGRRAVLIGCDCPGLTTDILRQAFAALHTHDLVVGPARDGGYYLIGWSRPEPELFTGIPWGTARVLEKTLAQAREKRVRVSLLAELADVDRPEDLAGWYGTDQGDGNGI